jgi:hypothetical protein
LGAEPLVSSFGEKPPPKNKKREKLPPLLTEQCEVPVKRRGLCEVGVGRRGTPSRMGGDACPTGTPTNLEL